jgi:hypothetical protein
MTVPGNIGLSKTQIEALIRENRRFNCGERWGTNQALAIDWRQFSAPVYYWIKAPLNFYASIQIRTNSRNSR